MFVQWPSLLKVPVLRYISSTCVNVDTSVERAEWQETKPGTRGKCSSIGSADKRTGQAARSPRGLVLTFPALKQRARACRGAASSSRSPVSEPGFPARAEINRASRKSSRSVPEFVCSVSRLGRPRGLAAAPSGVLLLAALGSAGETHKACLCKTRGCFSPSHPPPELRPTERAGRHRWGRGEPRRCS